MGRIEYWVQLKIVISGRSNVQGIPDEGVVLP